MNASSSLPLLALVAASLTICGCTAPPTSGNAAAPSSRPSTATTSAPPAPPDLTSVCNPVIVAIGAAAVCAVAASGKRRVKTGATCGAVAMLACYLLNGYKVEQTQTAHQVQDDYLRQNSRLPEKATVTSYRSEVGPRTAVSKGQEVRLSSTIVAVPGRDGRGLTIEEEISIVDRLGETWGVPMRKSANAGSQAGEFRTSFAILVVDGMSAGVYTIRRALYVNNVPFQRDDTGTRFQVVKAGSAAPVAWWNEPIVR